MSPWILTASFMFFYHSPLPSTMPNNSTSSTKLNQIKLSDSVKLEVKPSVSLKGLDQKMHPTLNKAGKIWQKYGKTLVVTSTVEGKHCKGSKHYSGLAFDLRTRYFKKNIQAQVTNELSAELGQDFQVLLEKDHIHVEYNPLPTLETAKTGRYQSSPNTRDKSLLVRNP